MTWPFYLRNENTNAHLTNCWLHCSATYVKNKFPHLVPKVKGWRNSRAGRLSPSHFPHRTDILPAMAEEAAIALARITRLPPHIIVTYSKRAIQNFIYGSVSATALKILQNPHTQPLDIFGTPATLGWDATRRPTKQHEN